MVLYSSGVDTGVRGNVFSIWWSDARNCWMVEVLVDLDSLYREPVQDVGICPAKIMTVAANCPKQSK